MRRCRPFPWCCATCRFGGDGVCVVQHLLTAKGTGDGVAMLPRGALHRRTCKGARRGGQEFRADWLPKSCRRDYVKLSNVKHCLDFSFVFSAPLPAWRNLFAASGIFCGGRYQPGCTGIFWPADGTSTPVTISKKWEDPSSALPRKRTRVEALRRFSTCSLGLPVFGHRSQIMEGLRPFSYTFCSNASYH